VLELLEAIRYGIVLLVYLGKVIGRVTWFTNAVSA